MQWQYTLSEPDLDDAELRAATACIESKWLSMGPQTAQLEARFAQLHGAEFAIAVSSGTAALHLAFLAAGIGKSSEDEVIQPSLNFVAAANMTHAVGAKAVFADVESLANPTIDVQEVKRLITPRTKAVVVMHYGGFPASVGEIADVCKEHQISLIEDACHAPLTYAADAKAWLGTVGDIGCFSFFSNKNMVCGEGGMVVTNDPALAAKIRSFRSHGMTTLSWDRHKGRASTYDVEMHGFNYRTDDLRSSIAVAQLEKLDAANTKRRELVECYDNLIKASGQNGIAFVKPSAAGAGHLAVALVPPSIRDDVRQALNNRGVQNSLHYPPAHLFSAFRGSQGCDVKNTMMFSASAITLPLHTGLDKRDISTIVGSLIESVRECAK